MDKKKQKGGYIKGRREYILNKKDHRDYYIEKETVIDLFFVNSMPTFLKTFFFFLTRIAKQLGK